MKIIYLGSQKLNSTSYHRACALERLGHSISFLDPYQYLSTLPFSNWTSFIHYNTGYKFIQTALTLNIQEKIETLSRVDLVWVDSGELLGPACLRALKQLRCPIVLYNVDDPTGKRDGNRFSSLLKSLILYDLVVVVRTESEVECYQLGARNVLRVFRSYDEVAHKPFDDIREINPAFISDVAFIGTWMRHEKRDEFLLALVNDGVQVSIWGDQWEKSYHWQKLKQFHRGKAVYGRDYVAAIQGAKICLGLLSGGNRDLHTTRSLEVPFAGGVLCAERTVEHKQLYKEGVEALFWTNAEECAKICLQWLYDESQRDILRKAGMHRIRQAKLGNEDVCKSILDKVFC